MLTHIPYPDATNNTTCRIVGCGYNLILNFGVEKVGAKVDMITDQLCLFSMKFEKSLHFC